MFVMEDHLHHHHPHQQQQHQQHLPQHHISVNVDTSDRFPQWSLQETKEFLIIRADLDRSFMETKRNKLLWEVIATKMKEQGFNRSAEQCKCKWKNLVTRYKGCETIEPEAMRQQFPFFNEMQAIFAARMQRMLWAEAEGGASGSKKKAAQLSSDDEDDNEDSDADKGRVRKKKKGKSSVNIATSGSSSGNSNNLREILEDFMKQQIQMEMQWREAFEARENERRLKEMEWRQTMEALENERLMMDRRWREREEQRRMREEARAEKRDALITALLNKLRREDM
ncbi:Myb_DNA-bind_4 domain-containing protein [Cephalotus follicularis]|uniref:Myb_DNA-bind_4 domain-containing protein n=1 Tax=Cephalotus follicularis TaxID=3775 RepID=A0A1Q3D4F0_CEPFO|nr:Myb_DNA-bind_4 domain-containing protein [Cephalotus follicularis]